MAITNGYTTLALFKAQYLAQSGTNSADDAVIEDLIEAASRFIDQEVWPRRFYASTETHYFDLPSDGRTLYFNDYLLTATTLTNGDGVVISASDVDYIPIDQRASSPYYKVMIKPSASLTWVSSSAGNTTRVISLLGSWGYSSTTPDDINQACLELAHNSYMRRNGQPGDTITRITSGGLLIQPQDINSYVLRVLNRYPRELGIG